MDISQDDLSPGGGTVLSRGRRRPAHRTPEGRVRYWPSATATGWQYAGAAVAATFQLDGDANSGPRDTDHAAGADTGMTDQLTVDAWLTHQRVRGDTTARPVGPVGSVGSDDS